MRARGGAPAWHRSTRAPGVFPSLAVPPWRSLVHSGPCPPLPLALALARGFREGLTVNRNAPPSTAGSGSGSGTGSGSGSGVPWGRAAHFLPVRCCPAGVGRHGDRWRTQAGSAGRRRACVHTHAQHTRTRTHMHKTHNTHSRTPRTQRTTQTHTCNTHTRTGSLQAQDAPQGQQPQHDATDHKSDPKSDPKSEAKSDPKGDPKLCLCVSLSPCVCVAVCLTVSVCLCVSVSLCPWVRTGVARSWRSGETHERSPRMDDLHRNADRWPAACAAVPATPCRPCRPSGAAAQIDARRPGSPEPPPSSAQGGGVRAPCRLPAA
jgi:hypothetical protein